MHHVSSSLPWIFAIPFLKSAFTFAAPARKCVRGYFAPKMLQFNHQIAEMALKQIYRLSLSCLKFLWYAFNYLQVIVQHVKSLTLPSRSQKQAHTSLPLKIFMTKSNDYHFPRNDISVLMHNLENWQRHQQQKSKNQSHKSINNNL